MRVTSAFFVSALVRRYFAEGLTATVRRHGADEAGAIFIIIDKLAGTADLFGPAMQSVFDTDRPADRRFERVAVDLPPAALSERIAREVDFDPDAWFVEIEDRQGRLLFETEPT